MAVSLDDFRRGWNDLDALRWLLCRRLEVNLQLMASRSRETTTHYKWLLAADRRIQARVWLHEFKPRRERREGFAATVHNHRYSFQTLVLRGSYVNTLYQVSFDRNTLRVHSCEPVDENEVPAYARYAMSPNEYHSLRDIEDGTQTLVMESAPALSASFSLDQEGGRMVQHIPLEARVDALRRLPTELSLARGGNRASAT